jgi:hypothetical protein
MTTYLTVIDPGMTSGFFFGTYDDMTPLFRTGFRQLPGGATAFDEYMQELDDEGHAWDIIVCEKFAPRPMARTLKLEELEPIRIEGMLQKGFEHIHWQRPAAMVLRQGDTQAARKKNSDDLLRRNGWWLTGKDVGLKDANDANAAAKHALAYMRSIGHMPTIETHLR